MNAATLPIQVVEEIAYCKAGATPGWWKAQVFDARTGERVLYVIEADAAGSWVDRHKRVNDAFVTDGAGNLVVERLRMPVRIVFDADGARVRKAEIKRASKAARLRAAQAKGAIS